MNELIDGVCAGVQQRCTDRHVLAIEDTSELNYQRHARRVQGLGTVGNGEDLGLFIHPVLAVDAQDGACLGLADVHSWVRHKAKAKNYRHQPIESKESLRWISAAQAAVKRLNWHIEQLFRTLKSQGLDVESSLVEEAQRLQKLAVLACSAASRTMQLTLAREGRSARPAQDVFLGEDVAVLQALAPTLEGRTQAQKNPHPALSLAWASWVIARLGGWKGYASERKPGPITRLHGLQAFERIAQGWLIARSLQHSLVCIR